ncbi:MAG: ATP-dependent 6-phosphofructokinase [Planctomycetes bacterium]|nr:ATP-dependent 6-phosphofructokinase [Planctomycetota bacterium]
MAGNRPLRIGVLTGGGDCPGLNAVIRAVAKTLMHENLAEVVGFLDGYDGLVTDRSVPLDWAAVSNILTLGGTILGTSNTADPFRWAEKRDGQTVITDRSRDALQTFQKHRLDGLVVIGGDGSMAIAGRLEAVGVPVVGVPKTIDNDVPGTEMTFGFQSAVNVATDALDRLHTTASAHHRVMIAEVMGRYAGWLALHSGIAGGADVILIPEIPFRWEPVFEVFQKRARHGKRFSIICVAEGARPAGGEMVIQRTVEGSPDPVRLGGIGRLVAGSVEQQTGMEARATSLGYVQRGGTPCPFDRVFATSLGYVAARLVADRRWGRMASWQQGRLTDVAVKDVAGGCRKVPLDDPLLSIARAVGTSFGE